MPDSPTASREAHHAWVIAALEQHEQRLVRFAVRLLGDEETARDVVQHAFLQLCRQPQAKAEELGTGEPVARWLFCVIRRRAYDLFRRQQRQGEANGQPADELLCEELGPVSSLEQKELGELMLSLVDHLPHAQRESVLLWAEGYSGKEIAQITERAPATVRVHLHKALNTLRDHPSVRKLRESEEHTNDVTSLNRTV